MKPPVFIPKSLWLVSLGLHAVFMICLGIWILRRTQDYEITRTIFSFSRLDPKDSAPVSGKQCRQRDLPIAAPMSVSLLIIGDSITQFGAWEELLSSKKILNHGIEGDWTDCLLYRLPLSIGVKPKNIIIMAGINDLMGHRDALSIAANHWRIISTLRRSLPGTRVFLASILPVSEPLATSIHPEQVVMTNRWLEKTAEDLQVSYIDGYSTLSDKNGRLRKDYSHDGVHLNQGGYLALASVWRKHLGAIE